MRKFNEFEKEILFKIVNNESYISNIIDYLLSDVRIVVNRVDKKVSYLFDVEDKKNITDIEKERSIKKLTELNGIIITLVNLITYLDKREWITIVKTVKIDNHFISFGQGVSYKDGVENDDYINYEMSDPNIIEKFIRYCYNSILPTSELTYFVNAGFVTEEEINYQKEEKRQQKNNQIALLNLKTTNENIRLARSNNKAAWIVATVASFALIVSILSNFYGQVSLNDEQLNNILEKFDRITSSIDSIETNSDTLDRHQINLETQNNFNSNEKE